LLTQAWIFKNAQVNFVSTVAKKAGKRGRVSYRETFLKSLVEISDDGKNLVSNKALRDTLGWDEELYKRIKAQLVDERVVIIARGYGGTLGLTSPKGTKALNVFVSYSHKDEAFKDDLIKHLSPLKRLGYPFTELSDAEASAVHAPPTERGLCIVDDFIQYDESAAVLVQDQAVVGNISLRYHGHSIVDFSASSAVIGFLAMGLGHPAPLV
jgi:hypothetical protein